MTTLVPHKNRTMPSLNRPITTKIISRGKHSPPLNLTQNLFSFFVNSKNTGQLEFSTTKLITSSPPQDTFN